MSDIFILKDGQQMGPFRPLDVRALVDHGHFQWSDDAWTDGMEEWQPLQEAITVALQSEAPSPPAVSSSPREEQPERTFFEELPRALLYPFTGDGRYFLFFGTIGALALKVVGIVPVIGWIAALLLAGYFFAYMFKIVRETAVGENEMAGFPELTDVWDDVVRPFSQVLLIFIGCLVPAVAAGVLLVQEVHQLVWLPELLLLAGLVYLPMALLIVAVFDSVLGALNPLIGIPSILRVPLRYLVILMMFFALAIVRAVIGQLTEWGLPTWAGLLVLAFLGFYTAIVQARLLGLIFKTGAADLNWFR